MMRTGSFFTLLFPVIMISTVSYFCSGQSPTQSANPPPETGIITGQVTLFGSPCADAQVILTDSPDISTTSDTNGYYSLQGIPPGNHIIKATISSGGSSEFSVYVRAGETSYQDLGLNLYTPAPETGTITGRVTYADGPGFSEAEVTLTDISGFTAISGVDGYYTLQGVPAGDHTIKATVSGGGSGEIPIHVWANQELPQDLVLSIYSKPPPTRDLHVPIDDGTQVFALPQNEIKTFWFLNFGKMELIQNGSQIRGIYQNDFNGFNGTFQGVVSGNVFDGTWSRNNNSGPIHWVVSPDGKTINGNFNGSSQWCGALKGSPFPAGCSFAGDWTSNVAGNQNCAMILTRIDMTVTGNYCNGSVAGTISYTENSNETMLNGTWQTQGSGTFQLYLLEYDALQFVGHWDQNGYWCGWRSNSVMPSPCLR